MRGDHVTCWVSTAQREENSPRWEMVGIPEPTSRPGIQEEVRENAGFHRDVRRVCFHLVLSTENGATSTESWVRLGRWTPGASGESQPKSHILWVLINTRTKDLNIRCAPLSAFFFFLVAACEILFPDQGLNLGPQHWEWSLNHWTSREVLENIIHVILEKMQSTYRLLTFAIKITLKDAPLK